MPWHTLGFTGGCKGELLVKRINASAALISLLLGFAVTQAHAEDYYIYQAPNGALVISNKEPPPGTKIIRQHNWADITESEVPQGQKPAKPLPNVEPKSSPKPSTNK